MAKFTLTDMLNGQSLAATKPSAATFNVVQIPIEKIRPSIENKYGIRDVEELAASIEEIGMLHNLVVRPPDADGDYAIISGERRYRACMLLLQRGNEAYATLPCVIDTQNDDAIAELKLLHANATARELTDYEKVMQAARIKELLLKLKADGYKFKGRMREIVADMVGVSPAQMGRMESISSNLAPELTHKFASGNIGVTQAYELSTLPKAEQRAAAREIERTGNTDKPPARKQASEAERTPHCTCGDTTIGATFYCGYSMHVERDAYGGVVRIIDTADKTVAEFRITHCPQCGKKL